MRIRLAAALAAATLFPSAVALAAAPAQATGFDWNWQYAAPTCDSLAVDYPSDLPSGQSNDVNMRFAKPDGTTFTLNFHHNTGTWSGHTVFDYKAHAKWPAGLTTYDVVWVQVGGTNYHWQGQVSCAPPPPPVVDPTPPFDWNWQYPDPTCTALNVTYPSNIPAGQANDANVRFESNVGQFTLNFHHNTGTWSGAHAFDFQSHPQWPAGVTSYQVVWTQVGGTNYHWQGSVACSTAPAAPAAPPAAPAPADPAPAAPAPADPAPAAPVPAISGFTPSTTTVGRGTAPGSRWISVSGSHHGQALVQQLKNGVWKTVSTTPILSNGQAKVSFPKLDHRGSYQFRVSVDGSCSGSVTFKVH